MYRNWFDGIYQRKNLKSARIEFEDGDGKAMNLSSFTIGQFIHLHVTDGLTQANYHFPGQVIAIRFSNEVWYDLLLFINAEKTIGVRVNRIRGANLSLHPTIPSDDEDMLASEVMPTLLKMLEEEGIKLESSETPVGYASDPVSYFGKQLYLGQPRTVGTKIRRLFVAGEFSDITPKAQLGDSVSVLDENDGVMVRGIVNEIHVEDEFYYSVAVPCGDNQYIVLHKLDSETITHD